MEVIRLKLTTYIYFSIGLIITSLSACCFYAHFSGKIKNITDQIYDQHGNLTNYTKINGNVVEYWHNCTEMNIALLTITHTFTTLTPGKWIFRLCVAWNMPYLLVILPIMFDRMFKERHFLENSRFSSTSIKYLARMAGVSEIIGWLAALGIVFCLDVYYNDTEGAPNVMDAPTPIWHWALHLKFYFAMIFGYVGTSLIYMILLLQTDDKCLQKQHGYIPKLCLTLFTTVTGLCSVYYLFRDYEKCEDNLNFKFAVHEYCFVFGSFILLGEYARYFKDKELVVRFQDTVADRDGNDRELQRLERSVDEACTQ